MNPNITFEVLIHKVDGLSDDYKIGMCGQGSYHSMLIVILSLRYST